MVIYIVDRCQHKNALVAIFVDTPTSCGCLAADNRILYTVLPVTGYQRRFDWDLQTELKLI